MNQHLSFLQNNASQEPRRDFSISAQIYFLFSIIDCLTSCSFTSKEGIWLLAKCCHWQQPCQYKTLKVPSLNSFCLKALASASEQFQKTHKRIKHCLDAICYPNRAESSLMFCIFGTFVKPYAPTLSEQSPPLVGGVLELSQLLRCQFS
jgi:hypothetical protein